MDCAVQEYQLKQNPSLSRLTKISCEPVGLLGWIL